MQTPGLLLKRALLRPAGALALLAASAASAQAQAPAAPDPAAAANTNIPTYGPPLPGVCIFSRDTALGTSQAGVSVIQQLSAMETSAKADLDKERDSITAEDKSLGADKAKLPPAKYQERQAALQQRVQTYEATIQIRNNQFARTREKAMDQIAQTVTPILVSSITAHKCSLVIERGGIYGGNAAMDLTPEVIQKLNAAMPTYAVTLEPAQAPAQ